MKRRISLLPTLFLTATIATAIATTACSTKQKATTLVEQTPASGAEQKAVTEEAASNQTTTATAEAQKAKERYVIVNGHFFKETPEEVRIAMKEGSVIMMVKAAGAPACIGINLPNDPSEAVLERAIPVDEVPDGNALIVAYKMMCSMQSSQAAVNAERALINPGDKFLPFTSVDMEGRMWSNKDIEGKVMVLNLWYTGCGPCRAEMPELSEWKTEMPDVMFFSATFEKPEVARRVIEAKQFSWIPLVNDSTFTKLIGSNGYPMTLVVDKQGIVQAVEHGSTAIQRERLKKKIEELR